MHADRTNRTATIVLALILLGGGLSLALLSLGAFGQQPAERTISDNVIWQYVGDNGHWLWAAAAGVSLIVLYLCVRWIVALLASTDRVSEVAIAGDRTRGRTVLASGAVVNALTDEIETYPGVASSSARLIGAGVHPELVVQVELTQSADVREVRDRLTDEALEHVRRAVDDPGLPVTFELGMTREAGARVR